MIKKYIGIIIIHIILSVHNNEVYPTKIQGFYKINHMRFNKSCYTNLTDILDKMYYNTL